MEKIYEVTVIGLNGLNTTVGLCNTEEQMEVMTVLQFKRKIVHLLPGNAGSDMDNIRLVFSTEGLDDDERTLFSYGVQNRSLIQMVIRVKGGFQ